MLHVRREIGWLLSLTVLASAMDRLAPAFAQAPSTAPAAKRSTMSLTPVETTEGWRLIFDGSSIDGWRGYKQEGFPSARWSVVDGCLKSAGGEGASVDLVTKGQYGDFELICEFKTEPKANSGIIYRATEKHDASWQTGPEFQVLDDPGAGVTPDDAHSCGAIYDLYTPIATKALKPAGQFNLARIRLVDGYLQHWLNGVKVLECDLKSDEWKAKITGSKFKDYEGFGLQPFGHIVLQDHGDVVWYRNIRIRSLDAPMPNQFTLFDGKSLNGWTQFAEHNLSRDATWKVEDGVIVCSGDPAGYIRTERSFQNFVLRLQWRFSPVTKKAGNSGVLLRMVGEDKIWPKSVEAQLLSGNAGDFYSIDNFPMRSDIARMYGRRIARIRGAERPVGEWNEYEIIADRGVINLFINGEMVNQAEYVEEIPGRICLQSEGAEIHFRNIGLALIPNTAD